MPELEKFSMTTHAGYRPRAPRDEGTTIMKNRFARRLRGLATGLAFAAAAVPALAADMGGIKDYGGAGGVPVPAPVPIPEYEAEWYIGVAAGGVLIDDGTTTECCTSMPVREDYDKTLFGGISAGRYLTSSLRAEVAFDFYDDFKVAGPATQSYTDTQSANGSTVVGHYDVTRTDNVKVGRTTGMFNMFYDIPLSERIKPYVGAGIGVTWREMKRRYHEEATCTRTTDDADPTFNSTSCSNLPDGLERTYNLTGEEKTDRFDVALAAMAGVSVEVTPDIIWDNGYQLLWESNSIALTTPTHCGACNSTVTYGDVLHHQFRTGLRFLID